MELTKKLSEVLDSPRAAAALKRAGFVTIGDVHEMALGELASINGVGERTLEQLQTCVKLEEAVDYGTVEEGEHDIHLLSPRPGYVIWVLRGDRIVEPQSGASRVVPPILIQFRKGRGKISRKTFLMRKYRRNELQVQEHLDAGKPWRVECAEWLKSRQKHPIEYTLMSD